MKSRVYTMLFIAIVLAGGAAWLASRWLETARQGITTPQSEETTTIVVAALPIPFAKKIETIHVKTVEWPSRHVPKGVFDDPTMVVGKVANQSIVPDEPILEDRVVEYLGGSTLAAFIKPNMRAVSVRVNDVTGVGGFVLPGNYIDAIQTKRNGASRIILEDVKVLAVDQEASPDKDKPAVVRAVTLELMPEQAEYLAGASQEGSIQLALRNPLDDSTVARAPQPAATVTPTEVQPPPQRRFFNIVRGDTNFATYQIR